MSLKENDIYLEQAKERFEEEMSEAMAKFHKALDMAITSSEERNRVVSGVINQLTKQYA